MNDNFRVKFHNFLSAARAQTSLSISLLMLRLYFGVFYITTGENKISKGDWGLGYEQSLIDFVNGAIENSWSLYAAFLENIVLPNSALFTLFVSWGELLLGISMLLGISVRLAGFMGSFMALNFALSSGRALWLPSFDVTLSIALLTLAFARAGRCFGVDQYLSKKYKNYWIG